MQTIDELSTNTLRFLAVEAIEKAKSGHPGLPLGAAPAAYALWGREMKHNPKNPAWENRDRFVLSAGHGSALLYALLHVFGYGLGIDDLKQFRQLDSRAPGHPEYGVTTGVEMTTGPLGQGIASAAGIAWAEQYLAAQFNKEGFPVVDHYTFALCGDGCLMEGVSAEAASLAGTLGLGKLIVLYDCNKITIEGSTEAVFNENVEKRFHAYHWQIITVDDGNNVNSVAAAIRAAKAETEMPSLIIVHTEIGFGSPNKQGKAAAHGEPLGEDEIRLTKEKLSWPYEESFFVPDEVRANVEEINKKNAAKEQVWDEMMKSYQKAYPELWEKWQIWHAKKLPVDLFQEESLWQITGDLATRAASSEILQKIAELVPNLIGGSADLAPSNKSVMKNREYFSSKVQSGSNLQFGIREFAMTAIANGMALHGGLRPYIAGFFVFSDYMKAALRLSALMQLPVISVLTHDSIGVGEDGPTHQPVEHLAALRSMPGYTVFRPCDSHETAAGWCAALTADGPTALVLSRQNLPLLPETGKEAVKGAYILKDTEKETPDVILMASGSEVSLIYHAYEELKKRGVGARVVSMPSFELFEKQSQEYKESVLPNAVRARVAVEAAASFGWHKYTGLDGEVISIDTFGASAPAERLFEKFGFTTEHVVEVALKVCGKA